MKPSTLRYALMISVLINLGVLVTIGIDTLRPVTMETARSPSLPTYLGLDASQLKRWQAAEEPFLRQFGTAAAQIETHRTAMIRAIFADVVDRQGLETERAAIARLQHEQQRLLIEQLLAEREILDAEQRRLLAQLLLEQPEKPSALEDLHGR